MLILACDSSSIASGALVRTPGSDLGGDPEEAEVLGVFRTQDTRSHAEVMAPGLAGLLAEAGVEGKDLDLVLTGLGPGPFTGLRAGIMTARALGWAWGVPVRGLSSLDALAEGAWRDARAAGLDRFQVASDARRREVYAAAYRLVPEGWQRQVGPVVGPADQLGQLLGTGEELLPTAGRGAALYPEALSPLAGHEQDQPLAENLVRAAVRGGQAALAENTSPLYLRGSDARVPASRKKALQAPAAAATAGDAAAASDQAGPDAQAETEKQAGTEKQAAAEAVPQNHAAPATGARPAPGHDNLAEEPNLPSGTSARAMTEADVPAVHRLETALFPADAWPVEMFLAERRHPTRSYTVVEADGEIIAYAGAMAVAETGDVQTVAVRPDHEGRGIGRWLMRHLQEWAAGRGARTMILEVRADNPRAQGLYRSLGYRTVHRRARYYRDGTDAEIMSLELPAAPPEPAVQPAPSAPAEPAAQPEPPARQEPAGPVVMGIESSCDETGIGIVAGDRLLTNTVSSSMAEHVRFGGVIPEIASRAHLEAMVPALEAALAEAGVGLEQVQAIAVTSGPGLAGALMVGVSAAKALSAATGIPLYAVNHLVSHVGVGLLQEATVPGRGFPEHQGPGGSLPEGLGSLPEGLGALLVSGGHTEILAVRDVLTDVRLLGATLDDAAGEAYDKVARILGLDYPGGPAIDRAAAAGDPQAFAFPRGLTAGKYLGSAEAPGSHRYDFSFSGLKTAVARVVEGFEARGEQVPVADVAASFQEAVADVVSRKAVMACTEHGITTLLLGGGVAANSRLRELVGTRCAAAGIRLVVPRPSLCTDNGAMVAALGARLVAAGVEPTGLDFGTDPSLPVTTVSVPPVSASPVPAA